MPGVGPAEVAPQRQGQAVQVLLVPRVYQFPGPLHQNHHGEDFPGSSVVKTPFFQYMGHGFDVQSAN